MHGMRWRLLQPKIVWRFKLRQHGPSHINKILVLPLSYTILLRGICSGIFVFYPLITKKSIQGVVLELGVVVASYHQHWFILLMLNHIDEVNEVLLGLTLQLEEVYPCISSIVINNHQTIFLPTKTCMG